MQLRTLESVVEVFGDKSLRTYLKIYSYLTRHGLKTSDLIDHYDRIEEQTEVDVGKGKIELEEMRKAWEAVVPLCPSCGGYLNPPRHICKKKGPENVKGYTCLWHCEKGDCIYEKYTYENAGEEMKRLMEKGREEQCR
ncbi:hypothetical protein LCGC14_0890100 [marine sediment metagenome]|uniref:Uncharacterized protein n=1 Tax=marine sediment metagenome TaxID=412755 RepID=A0A0F9NZK0_9ZZZZ